MVAAVALTAGLALAQTQSSGDMECVGTLPPGVYDGNVVVPEGEFCDIQDSELRGNVLVRGGAQLNLFRNTVRGDVKGVADNVLIWLQEDNTVLGNVEVLRDSGLFVHQNTQRGTGPDGAPLGLRGDVKAGQNSNLVAADSTILGNVVGDKARNFEILDSSIVPGASVVGKNVVHKDGTDGFSRICGTTVEDGNIRVERVQNSYVLVSDDQNCGPFFDGRNFGGGNRVLNGDIKVSENTMTDTFRPLGVDDNFVPKGHLKIFKNTGPGPKTVQNNQVGKVLQCFENSPPFVGGPNLAQKAEGQCF